ncbi:MAG: YchJ family protein [Gammaproteobacteria bacterium]
MKPCACGSKKDYADCCQPFIDGTKLPSTPEALMRSRYTAYTQRNIDYIAKTMASPASDGFNAEEAKAWAEQCEWLKLEVIEASYNQLTGFVEFIAHFNHHQQRQMIHEKSEFHLINSKWVYVNGTNPQIKRSPQVKQLGRNEPCLCGSGKKYKTCCGK